MDGERDSGFLPPEPAGPEPELGNRPAQDVAASPQPAEAQQPTQGYPPPGQPYAAPPPQGYAPPPPGQGYPAQPGGGWAPPPGQQWQQAPPPWGYPQQQVPDNSPAVAGFVLSLVSVTLLLFTAGLSSIVSVGCSIAAVVLGRKGVKRVDAGETPKNRGLAQAGFWIGVTGLVLSVLATLGWIAFGVLLAIDDEARQDFENELDESNSLSALLAGAARVMTLVLT